MAGRKTARKALIARRVLEIYAHGGGWPDVIAEFGQPRDPKTGRKWKAVQLLDWAHANYLTDDERDQGRAAVEAELRLIGFTQVDEIKASDKLGALKQLGQLYGGFAERVEHTGKDGGPVQYQDMTEEEIDRRIAELGAKVGNGGRTGGKAGDPGAS